MKSSKLAGMSPVIPIFLCLIIAIILPLIFKSDLLLSILCEIGIMAIFALSYNMLLGQTGLLSFGHAVYYGIGAFGTIHTLNILKHHSFISISMLPLIGGLTALLLAIIFGFVSTKKSGTTFSMITLGLGEMVHSCSVLIPDFFGGEGGISGNRMIMKPDVFGISYGPQIQFYFLVLVWLIISAIFMFFITKTPLGKMANAVRDNHERAEFIGYNPQKVRFYMTVLSGFFAGISGGLTALNYEIVTAETLNAGTSGIVLLMSFVGGIGSFFGPIIGAVVITMMKIFVGGLSKAWLLYLGILFITMVLFIPGGIAGILKSQSILWSKVSPLKLIPKYLISCIPIICASLGVILVIEMTYVFLGNDTNVSQAHLMIAGLTINTSNIFPWIASVGAIVIGKKLFELYWHYSWVPLFDILDKP